MQNTINVFRVNIAQGHYQPIKACFFIPFESAAYFWADCILLICYSISIGISNMNRLKVIYLRLRLQTRICRLWRLQTQSLKGNVFNTTNRSELLQASKSELRSQILISDSSSYKCWNSKHFRWLGYRAPQHFSTSAPAYQCNTN